jgi:hypothetical protein
VLSEREALIFVKSKEKLLWKRKLAGKTLWNMAEYLLVLF